MEGNGAKSFINLTKKYYGDMVSGEMEYESFDSLLEYFEKNMNLLNQKNEEINALNRPEITDVRIAMEAAREAHNAFKNNMTMFKISRDK